MKLYAFVEYNGQKSWKEDSDYGSKQAYASDLRKNNFKVYKVYTEKEYDEIINHKGTFTRGGKDMNSRKIIQDAAKTTTVVINGIKREFSDLTKSGDYYYGYQILNGTPSNRVTKLTANEVEKSKATDAITASLVFDECTEDEIPEVKVGQSVTYSGKNGTKIAKVVKVDGTAVKLSNGETLHLADFLKMDGSKIKKTTDATTRETYIVKWKSNKGPHTTFHYAKSAAEAIKLAKEAAKRKNEMEFEAISSELYQTETLDVIPDMVGMFGKAPAETKKPYKQKNFVEFKTKAGKYYQEEANRKFNKGEKITNGGKNFVNTGSYKRPNSEDIVYTFTEDQITANITFDARSIIRDAAIRTTDAEQGRELIGLKAKNEQELIQKMKQKGYNVIQKGGDWLHTKRGGYQCTVVVREPNNNEVYISEIINMKGKIIDTANKMTDTSNANTYDFYVTYKARPIGEAPDIRVADKIKVEATNRTEAIKKAKEKLDKDKRYKSYEILFVN